MNKEGGVSLLTVLREKIKKEKKRKIEADRKLFSGRFFALTIPILCTTGLTGSLAFLTNNVKPYYAQNKRVIQHLRCLQGRLMARTQS